MFNFDATQVKPQESFDPVPDAWYNLRIVESEVKPTKRNDGAYVEFVIEVVDGEHASRKIWDRINKWAGTDFATGAEDPAKAQTREIANRQLSAYCHATGVLNPQGESWSALLRQLHGIPFKGKVAIRKDEGFEPSNVIKAVKHIQDGAPVTSAASPFPAAPVPASAVPMRHRQNPALPVQPAPATPWGAPAQAPAVAPFAPPVFSPPGTLAPSAGPVPPWRR